MGSYGVQCVADLISHLLIFNCVAVCLYQNTAGQAVQTSRQNRYLSLISGQQHFHKNLQLCRRLWVVPNGCKHQCCSTCGLLMKLSLRCCIKLYLFLLCRFCHHWSSGQGVRRLVATYCQRSQQHCLSRCAVFTVPLQTVTELGAGREGTQ